MLECAPTMDQELWKKIEEIYHAALERPLAERDDFLNRACASSAAESWQETGNFDSWTADSSEIG